MLGRRRFVGDLVAVEVARGSLARDVRLVECINTHVHALWVVQLLVAVVAGRLTGHAAVAVSFGAAGGLLLVLEGRAFA